jgi:hypothetical protein
MQDHLQATCIERCLGRFNNYRTPAIVSRDTSKDPVLQQDELLLNKLVVIDVGAKFESILNTLRKVFRNPFESIFHKLDPLTPEQQRDPANPMNRVH